MILVSLVITKNPIASGGRSPPDPLLQRYTSVFRPPSQKILDPPLNYTCNIPVYLAISYGTAQFKLYTRVCLHV